MHGLKDVLFNLLSYSNCEAFIQQKVYLWPIFWFGRIIFCVNLVISITTMNKTKDFVHFYFLDYLGSRFFCPNNCGRSYKKKNTLGRHLRYECGVEPKFKCHICYKKFPYELSMKLHMASIHKRVPISKK